MNIFNCFFCNALATWKCECSSPCTYSCPEHLPNHFGTKRGEHPITNLRIILEPEVIENIQKLYERKIEEITLQTKNFIQKVDKILRELNNSREKVIHISETMINEKKLILEGLKTSPLDFWSIENIAKINKDNVKDWLVEINFFDYGKLENEFEKFSETWDLGKNKMLKKVNNELAFCKNELKNQGIILENKEKILNELCEKNKGYEDMFNKWDSQIEYYENQLKIKDQLHEEELKEKEESWSKSFQEKEESFRAEYRDLENNYKSLIPNANMFKITEKENKIKELEEIIKEKGKIIEELEVKIQKSLIPVKSEQDNIIESKAQKLINGSRIKDRSETFNREKKIKTRNEAGYEPKPQKKAKFNN